MHHGRTLVPRRLVSTVGAVAALAAGLVVGGFAAPGAAQAQEVIVLGVRSFEGDDEFARNLTGALRHSASQVDGWQVSDREVTLAQMALVHGCDEITNSCMGEIAGSLEMQRILYGEVRRTNAGDNYDFSVNLYLFNAESGEIEHSVAETLPGERTDIDDVRGPVQRFVSSLSGAPRVGRIVVSVNVPGAQVFVDDAPVGTADAGGHLTVEDVEAGTRQLRVVAEGHDSFSATVSVEAYGEASFSAELQSGDGGGGGGGGTPVEMIVGGVLLGVGAVAAGLWVWSMVEIDGVQGDQRFIDARGATPLGADTCLSDSTVQDLCDTASTHEALQFVFLGTAVVAAGLGTYFLVAGGSSSSSAESATLRIAPSFGPNHGYVGLDGRF